MKFNIIKNYRLRNNFFLYEKKFKALKYIIYNRKLSLSVRWKASLILSELNSFSKIRIYTKCFLTGRSRGYSNFTGLSRIKLRLLARDGKLPFIRKASW